MKLEQALSVLFFLAFFLSCSINDDSPEQEVKTELMTAIIGPCEGDSISIDPGFGEVVDYPSMFIKFGDDKYQAYPTHFIGSFEFEPGYEYELSVEKTTTHYFKNIPMDGSNPSVRYTLKETLSKNALECSPVTHESIVND